VIGFVVLVLAAAAFLIGAIVGLAGGPPASPCDDVIAFVDGELSRRRAPT
jgi:hypothetical protein